MNQGEMFQSNENAGMALYGLRIAMLALLVLGVKLADDQLVRRGEIAILEPHSMERSQITMAVVEPHTIARDEKDHNVVIVHPSILRDDLRL